MPKKPMGYTPDKSQSNPTIKETVPMKTPSLKEPKLSGPNNVASVPGTRFPKLSRPAPMTPRTPKI